MPMVLCFCAMPTLYPLSVRAQQSVLWALRRTPVHCAAVLLHCNAAQCSTAQCVGQHPPWSSFVPIQSHPIRVSLTALVRVRSAATDRIGSDRILRHSSAHSVRRLQPLTTTLDLAALMWHTSQATSFVLANQVRLLPPRWVPAVPSHRVPRCTTCSSGGVDHCCESSHRHRVVLAPAWWYLARGTRVVPPFAAETVAHHPCICARRMPACSAPNA